MKPCISCSRRGGLLVFRAGDCVAPRYQSRDSGRLSRRTEGLSHEQSSTAVYR